MHVHVHVDATYLSPHIQHLQQLILIWQLFSVALGKTALFRSLLHRVVVICMSLMSIKVLSSHRDVIC